MTYNAGVDKTFLYTTHQDYWAGELVNLKTPANARYLDNGLQWFGWTCLDFRGWVTPAEHRNPQTAVLRRGGRRLVPDCNSHQAPMTFNVGIYQDGTMAQASVEQLRRLGTALRK